MDLFPRYVTDIMILDKLFELFMLPFLSLVLERSMYVMWIEGRLFFFHN